MQNIRFLLFSVFRNRSGIIHTNMVTQCYASVKGLQLFLFVAYSYNLIEQLSSIASVIKETKFFEISS